MGKQVRIVALHGIGNHETGFYEAKLKRIQAALESASVHVTEASGVLYAHHAATNANAYWDDIDHEDIALKEVRKFLLDNGSDATVYGTKPHKANSNYRKIHDQVKGHLTDQLGRMVDGERLVVWASSFGGHLFSDLLWDEQKKKTALDSDLRERLALLVTTGCNIPLFVAGLQERELFERPNDAFSWLNIFDRDDILGWPLRPLGGAYAADWISDTVINAGLPVISHRNYWTRRRVVERIKDTIVAAVS